MGGLIEDPAHIGLPNIENQAADLKQNNTMASVRQYEERPSPQQWPDCRHSNGLQSAQHDSYGQADLDTDVYNTCSFMPAITGSEDGSIQLGSTYQILHTTLRKHALRAAHATAPSRQLSLVHSAHGGTPTATSDKCSVLDVGTPADVQVLRESAAPELSEEQEYLLWKSWIVEIAGWVSSSLLLE